MRYFVGQLFLFQIVIFFILSLVMVSFDSNLSSLKYLVLRIAHPMQADVRLVIKYMCKIK